MLPNKHNLGSSGSITSDCDTTSRPGDVKCLPFWFPISKTTQRISIPTGDILLHHVQPCCVLPSQRDHRPQISYIENMVDVETAFVHIRTFTRLRMISSTWETVRAWLWALSSFNKCTSFTTLSTSHDLLNWPLQMLQIAENMVLHF